MVFNVKEMSNSDEMVESFTSMNPESEDPPAMRTSHREGGEENTFDLRTVGVAVPVELNGCLNSGFSVQEETVAN